MVRCRAKRFGSASHRQMGGPQDVEPVDFLAVSCGDSPMNFTVGGELLVKELAFRSADFFGIVESGAGETFR